MVMMVFIPAMIAAAEDLIIWPPPPPFRPIVADGKEGNRGARKNHDEAISPVIQ